VGQVFECWMGLGPSSHLGLAASSVPFDRDATATKPSKNTFRKYSGGAAASLAKDWVYNPDNSRKIQLVDGRTGEPFDQKPGHRLAMPHPQTRFTLVDDKDPRPAPPVPTRSSPSQPLGGRRRQGDALRGMMEVWAWRPTALLHPAGTAHRQIRRQCSGRNEALNRHRQRASPIPPSRQPDRSRC